MKANQELQKIKTKTPLTDLAGLIVESLEKMSQKGMSRKTDFPDNLDANMVDIVLKMEV